MFFSVIRWSISMKSPSGDVQRSRRNWGVPRRKRCPNNAGQMVCVLPSGNHQGAFWSMLKSRLISMQGSCGSGLIERCAQRTRTRMVNQQSPALRRFHVDVGCRHVSVGHAIVRWHFHTLHQAMHTALTDHRLPHMGRHRTHSPCLEQTSERLSDGHCTHQPWPAWVHTHRLVLIGPTCHKRFQICSLQGLVKGLFQIVHAGIGRESSSHCTIVPCPPSHR